MYGKQIELPLCERVIQSKDYPCTQHEATQPERPSQFKCWSEENMTRAVSAVVTCGISIRKAATMYGIPRSTLGDRITGRVLEGSKSGPLRYLSEQEEAELITFIIGCAEIGYPKTVKDILALVQKILLSRGIYREVTYGWWEGFRKRHQELSLRVASTISKARALASNREVMDRYFDLLEETLAENDLRDKPAQVYNLDETGMPLDPKALKTIHVRGERNPYAVSSGQKTQISILACVSATGQCIPPLVIWDRKKVRKELTLGEVPGTMNGLSQKGWMTQDLFEKWFSQHFLRHAVPTRPLLLLMDGHSSHYSPVAIKMAAEEGVLLFTLPPNTTHLTQPLDKGVFGPLKMSWRRTCHNFMSKNPGQVVNRYNFSRLFSSAWFESMTAKNIISGFRTTGIFPVNRDAITLPGQKARSLAERTGLSYIPVLTPSKKVKKMAFSQEEIECYEFHLENNLHLDEQRYQLWLQSRLTYQSSSMESSSSDDGDSSLIRGEVIPYHSNKSQLFKIPSPVHKKVSFDDKHRARVLTSVENLRELEEKQKKKTKGKKQTPKPKETGNCYHNTLE